MAVIPFKLNYDYKGIEKECRLMGLEFDWSVVQEVDRKLAGAGLTQNQVNLVVVAHAQEVDRLFTPKNFSWKTRFVIALLFLGLVRRRKKKC